MTPGEANNDGSKRPPAPAPVSDTSDDETFEDRGAGGHPEGALDDAPEAPAPPADEDAEDGGGRRRVGPHGQRACPQRWIV